MSTPSVVIWYRAGDLFERDGTAGLRLILDREAPAEIVARVARENLSQHIGAAAGRKRHHQLDNPVGVWLRADAGRSAYQRRQDNEAAFITARRIQCPPPAFASLEVLHLPLRWHSTHAAKR